MMPVAGDRLIRNTNSLDSEPILSVTGLSLGARSASFGHSRCFLVAVKVEFKLM